MRFSLVIALLMSSFAFGQDQIRLPEVVKPANEVRSEVSRLAKEEIFVIDSDVEVAVVVSPEKPVKVVSEEGPIRIRGKFAGGEGKLETRVFPGKFITIIEPKEIGTTEIFVIPLGLKSKDDIVRRVIDVDAGKGPIPPPNPDPKPNPEPQPQPEPAKGPFYIAVIRDVGKIDFDTGNLLADVKFWDGLKTDKSDWGFFSHVSELANKNGYLKLVEDVQKANGGSANNFVPSLLILDKATGKRLSAMKLPVNKEEITKEINKLKGVK